MVLKASRFLLPCLLLIISYAIMAEDVEVFPVRHMASFNQTYHGNVSKHYPVQYNFSSFRRLRPFRLYLSAPNADQRDWPLVAVAKHGGSLLTVTLPFLFVEHNEGGSAQPRSGQVSTQYHSLARTVCPQVLVRQSGTTDVQRDNETIVELSTSSPDPISFTLSASLVEDFQLKVSGIQPVLLQPSSPQYYFFNFSDNQIKGRAVRVVVSSADSQVCMTLAIQQGICPVGDTPENVDHNGLFQTVLNKGDIYVSKEEYPTFFVVLLSYPTGEKCMGNFDSPVKQDKLPFYNYTKNFNITILPVPDPNIAVFASTTGVLLCVSLFIVVVALFVFNGAHPSEALGVADVGNDDERVSRMTIAELSGMDTDRHAYCIQMVLIGAFYCLPAVQLMFVLSNTVYGSGNLDKCFYNYACRVKVRITNSYGIHAFNNVFSNIGYIAAGFTFIFVCCRKERSGGSNRQTGVHECYSLYYACGAAIVMEGVMSATYHLCPSYYNFQYDTAFMLMIAGLLTLLIYSKRHPDVNPTAQVAYLALGIFIFINTFGTIVTQSAEGSIDIYVYLVLAALHLLLMVFLACKVYYMGKVSILQFMRCILKCTDPPNFEYPPDERPSGCMAKLCCNYQPRYPKTFAFLVVSCAVNLLCIVLYVLQGFNKVEFLPSDFADILLLVLVMNFLLYFGFYLLVKLCTFWPCRRDQFTISCCSVLLLVVASFVISFSALLFFVNAPTDWTQSPAKSRARNTDCLMFQQFDKHDIWHFLSAGALFCLLMLIFCMDNNDKDKPRDQLPVF